MSARKPISLPEATALFKHGSRVVTCCEDGHCGTCLSCELDAECKAHDATKAARAWRVAQDVGEGKGRIIAAADGLAIGGVLSLEDAQAIVDAHNGAQSCPEGF